MTEDPSKIRRDPRHKGAKRAFVLVPENSDALPLHIVDISKGGLSYRYLGEKKFESKKVNLYHESELIAEGIPVKSISDNRLQNNMLPLRRRSLRFEELSPLQNEQIERFIAVFTENTLASK
jgi:c-di-GMP-binding flagellar brake protein YcgR